jgi:hypothetical protein
VRLFGDPKVVRELPTWFLPVEGARLPGGAVVS